jgi:hypothetical protein
VPRLQAPRLRVVLRVVLRLDILKRLRTRARHINTRLPELPVRHRAKRRTSSRTMVISRPPEALRLAPRPVPRRPASTSLPHTANRVNTSSIPLRMRHTDSSLLLTMLPMGSRPLLRMPLMDSRPLRRMLLMDSRLLRMPLMGNHPPKVPRTGNTRPLASMVPSLRTANPPPDMVSRRRRRVTQ